MKAKAKSVAVPSSKSSSYSNSFFLITGNDIARAESYCRELLENFKNVKNTSVECETVDFENLAGENEEVLIRKAIEALKTLPFLSAEKIVWVRAKDALKSNSEESLSNILMNTLKQPIASQIRLLLSCQAVGKSSEIYQWFQKNGQVKEFTLFNTDKKADRAELESWVRQQFEAKGKKIHPQALLEFVDIVGQDSAFLFQEIEKLVLFSGNSEIITSEQVQQITSGEKETIFWKLRDAVGQRNLPEALFVLNRLLDQEEAPIQLLASLVHTIQDLLIVRRLLDQGILSASFAARRYWELEQAWKDHLSSAKTQAESDSERSFLSKHPFVVYQALQSARQFSSQDLDHALEALWNADELLKSTPLKAHWILETLLFQMLSKEAVPVVSLK